MRIILSTLIAAVIAVNSMAQQISAVETWGGILDKPELAEYFSGIFTKMGFIIDETKEEFTVVHHGDYFSIEQGIDKANVDYVVNLKMENVTNLVAHSSDNKIDEHESYRIMAALFTPLTEASLTSPTMSKPLMRKMADIENFIHVNLNGPDGESVSHTLIYLNKEWTVIPGKHGNAKRVFNLSPKDAIDYQRQVFSALQANEVKSWKAFKKWYIDWREGVSITVE